MIHIINFGELGVQVSGCVGPSSRIDGKWKRVTIMDQQFFHSGCVDFRLGESSITGWYYFCALVEPQDIRYAPDGKIPYDTIREKHRTLTQNLK